VTRELIAHCLMFPWVFQTSEASVISGGQRADDNSVVLCIILDAGLGRRFEFVYMFDLSMSVFLPYFYLCF